MGRDRLVDAVVRRRYVILAEGAFGELPSKTAMGVIAYGRDPVVAVRDLQAVSKRRPG
jgi:hypothetical protein